MTRKELTNYCKNRRIELGFTQQQIADILNIDKPRISEFENNRSNLSCDTLLLLFNVLKLQISQKDVQ